MTVLIQTNGKRSAKGQKMTTTGATTILTGSSSLSYLIDAIRWSAAAGGSTLSIWWNDGTSDIYLMNAESKGANTSGQIEGLHIPIGRGCTLKAQVGTANVIDITAVYIETSAPAVNTGSA